MKQSEHLKILQKLDKEYLRERKKRDEFMFQKGWDGAMLLKKETKTLDEMYKEHLKELKK